MQYVLRYNIKPGRESELIQWMEDHQEDTAKTAQEGWTYVGTWFTVMGFADYDVETRWELTGYGDLGTGPTPEGIELIKEWLDFVDLSRGTRAALMKSSQDVSYPL